MTAPSEAIAAGQRLLRALDQHLPGSIQGFYLTGSAVLGDFRPQSDLDVVVVTGSPLSPAEVSTARWLHRRLLLTDRRNYDIVFTTYAELSRPPSEAAPGFWACGVRSGVSQGPKHPVAWGALAKRGFALRGAPRGAFDVHDSDADLRTWCRDNLSTYWRRWMETSCAPLHWRNVSALTPRACVWGVLGVARVHHTILTGEIVSKSAAAQTALREWPTEHAPVVREARRIRENPGGATGLESAWARRRALLAAVRHGIETYGASDGV